MNTSLWKNPAFLVIITTSILIGFGQKIYSILLPLIVYDITESSELMGWMRAAEFLPNLLFALFIGIWIDRFNKKYWSIGSLLFQGIFLFLTYFISNFGKNYFPLLFIFVFLISTSSYCYYISQIVILKNSLSKDKINIATARLSTVNNFFDTIAPAISGLSLLFVSLYYPLMAVSFIFLVAAFVMTRLPYQEEIINIQQEKMGIKESLTHSWKLLKNYKDLYRLSWLIMLLNTSGSMFEIQMLFSAIDLFGFKSHQIGLLSSLAGCGALVGSYFAPHLRSKIGLGKTLIITATFEGFMFLLPPIIQTDISLYISFFLSTLAGSITSICIWSYRSEIVDSQHLGRISGITGSIFKIGMPVGLAASGYLVSMIGALNFLLFCAIFQIIATLMFINKKTLSII